MSGRPQTWCLKASVAEVLLPWTDTIHFYLDFTLGSNLQPRPILSLNLNEGCDASERGTRRPTLYGLEAALFQHLPSRVMRAGPGSTWGRDDTHRWHSPACRTSSSLLRALTVSSCSVELKTSRSRWHCRALRCKDKTKFSIFWQPKRRVTPLPPTPEDFIPLEDTRSTIYQNVMYPGTQRLTKKMHSELIVNSTQWVWTGGPPWSWDTCLQPSSALYTLSDLGKVT